MISIRQLIDAAVGKAPKHGGDHKSKDQVDIVNLKTKGGNSPTYALRRLKRDRPDLADKVVRGEISAHAAAIEAGFRKKPTPFEIVMKLLPKLTDSQWQAVVRARRKEAA